MTPDQKQAAQAEIEEAREALARMAEALLGSGDADALTTAANEAHAAIDNAVAARNGNGRNVTS